MGLTPLTLAVLPPLALSGQAKLAILDVASAMMRADIGSTAGGKGNDERSASNVALKLLITSCFPVA